MADITERLLNPSLYRRLCAVFGGRRNVRYHKVGQKGQFGRGGNYGRARLKRAGAAGSEEFSVRCPLCNDHARRLYFNYMWGTKDPYTGGRILWLCHCYNEECQSDYGNRQRLAELIFGNDTELLNVKEERAVEVEHRAARLPGAMQSLEVLAENVPDHPAVQFCYARGLSIREMTHKYGVGYCANADYAQPAAANRLVVPYYVRKAGKVELAGWTARRLSNDADTAKWLHSSNPTQNIVYGLAEAAAWRTILVVEGPGDRWGVGKYGAGVLGKTVGQPKAMRIAKAAGNHPDQNIVVLLDPTQDRVSKLRKRRHHIEVACESLRQYAKCGVHGVYLPAGTDPGSLDQQYTLDYVERELGEQGVRISWERK